MASMSIPWNDGNGNIVLTYQQGQGNDTVIVTSDTNNVGYDRQQQITFVVTDGAIRHIIGTSSGHLLRTSDGHYLRSLDNAMKVTVTVIQQKSLLKVVLTASDHLVCTASGNIVRCNTPN